MCIVHGQRRFLLASCMQCLKALNWLVELSSHLHTFNSFDSFTFTFIMSNLKETINILQNGITSILNVIGNLVTTWTNTATNLDAIAQFINQLATATSQSISIIATVNATATFANTSALQINVTVNPKSILLPEEFKGVKEKMVYFLHACNQYYAQTEVVRSEVKIAIALALMKGEKASK